MPIEPTNEQLFNRLTSSAFDFLHRALADFDVSPKFSIVHFAIAMELFLKARLLKEHWSLVVANPDTATRAAFVKGQLKTSTPDVTIKRLQGVAGLAIPTKAVDAFKTISEHRNKMVHFFHENENEKDGPKAALKTQIVVEQCRAWLELRKLLNGWEEDFEEFQGDLWKASSGMKQHVHFLESVYEDVKPELEKLVKAGNKISVCPSCIFKAAVTKDLTENFVQQSCRVCGYNEGAARVICANEGCKKEYFASAHDANPWHCEHCETEFSSDDLAELLDSDPVHQDNYFNHLDVNCAQCMGYHSVVKHYQLYVCTECLTFADEIGVCGWCNEGQLEGGNLEFSYAGGCEFCDGKHG